MLLKNRAKTNHFFFFQTLFPDGERTNSVGTSSVVSNTPKRVWGFLNLTNKSDERPFWGRWLATLMLEVSYDEINSKFIYNLFSWKCSMVQFLCVCILLREKSSSHVGGSWFWLLKKSSMIVVFLRWKLPHVFWTVWRTHIFWAVIELNLCFEFILDQKSKTFFLDFFLVYREDVFVFRPFFTCKRK